MLTEVRIPVTTDLPIGHKSLHLAVCWRKCQRLPRTVSDCGRLTTNTVEGFHGLALVYRDKRTDLGHTHYVCKTNMAICHKVKKKIKKKFLPHVYDIEFWTC